MPETVIIENVSVDFPYTPYPSQIDYMRQVIKTLNKEKSNALLESPTGTGKTLCLLCATLAWRIHKKEEGMIDLPTIMYASRTHTQLSQAINEFKKTPYSKSVVSSVRGSREQLCINPTVRLEKTQFYKQKVCSKLTASGSCQFKNNLAKNPPVEKGVFDIEELVATGTRLGACPYYMAKALSNGPDCDIAFVPYNYILDSSIRTRHDIDLEGRVIIFDEAHNIHGVCENISSIDITHRPITSIIKGVQFVIQRYQSDDDLITDDDAEKIMEIARMAFQLDTLISEAPLFGQDGHEEPHNGEYFYQLLQECDITQENKDEIVQSLKKVIDILEEKIDTNAEAGLAGFSSATAKRLRKQQTFMLVRPTAAGGNLNFQQPLSNSKAKVNIQDQFDVEMANSVVMVHKDDKQKYVSDIMTMISVLETVFGGSIEKMNEIRQHFKVVVRKDGSKVNSGYKEGTDDKEQRILSFLCLNPKFAMDSVREDARNIIMTSGTLTPLSYYNEFEIGFEFELENPHVITKDQYWVGVVKHGPKGEALNCTYGNRQNEAYLTDLGATILEMVNFVPEGVLVFFPNYQVMELCISFWKKSGQYYKLDNMKKIIIEPKKTSSFYLKKDEYEKQIQKDEKGAMFFGVCRGKMSEGLDFSDNKGRGVFIIGLPYPPLYDYKVVCKRRYLNQNRHDEQMNGDLWYELEGIRAVNQAIGRIIRHKNDFGAVILLDPRYEYPKVQRYVSKWVKDHLQVFDEAVEAKESLHSFYTALQKSDVGRALKTQQIANVKRSLEQTGRISLFQKAGKRPKKKIEIRQENEENIQYLYHNPNLSSRKTQSTPTPNLNLFSALSQDQGPSTPQQNQSRLFSNISTNNRNTPSNGANRTNTPKNSANRMNTSKNSANRMNTPKNSAKTMLRQNHNSTPRGHPQLQTAARNRITPKNTTKLSTPKGNVRSSRPTNKPSFSQFLMQNEDEDE